LHFESGALEVSFGDELWWTAHWEPVPTAEGFRLRSRAKGDHFLEIIDGGVSLVPEVEAGQTLWQFDQVPATEE
jgi:hypothetical protein